MYAVIDVETTGGSSGRHRIIEIAIVKFDGSDITDRYHTLVNPGRQIPGFITALTGISNGMVSGKPAFDDIADAVDKFTADCVFVAHNVNFDYGFVKREFERLGRPYARGKLCTVRLSRKIMPGLPSYGLGSLCKHLQLRNTARHRAHGDAEVTARLLQLLIERDKENFIGFSMKRNSGEATLPPNLPRERFSRLPEETGIYYFHDARGKVVYVGKARNIKSRVSGHFTGKTSNRKRLFLNSIFDVTYRCSGNELIALLEESHEIKKYWPVFNRAQKKTDTGYGLYTYTDREGFRRLFVNKISKGNRPIATFPSFQEARSSLYTVVGTHSLCAKLSGLQKSTGPCHDHKMGTCDGACAGSISPTEYNGRVGQAIDNLANRLNNYAMIGTGRTRDERSVVLVRNGTYLGHGYADAGVQYRTFEELASCIDPFPDNQDVQRILSMYLRKPGNQQVLELVGLTGEG